MRIPFITTIALTLGLLPVISFADNTQMTPQQFVSACVTSWMDKGADATDKDAYRSFGEKYCTCASQMPLTNDTEVGNAARTCMTQTLIQKTMDKVKAQGSTTNVPMDKVQTECLSVWALLSPKMDDKTKQISINFCQCAGQKIADANKSNPVTDDQINTIASQCADKISGS